MPESLIKKISKESEKSVKSLKSENTSAQKLEASKSESQQNNRWMFFVFMLIGGFLMMPFYSIGAASEFWKFLYGQTKLGAINWTTTIPSPLVTLLMIKFEHILSIKTRLITSWGIQIIAVVAYVIIALVYKSSSATSSLQFGIFLFIIFFSVFLFAVTLASFMSFTSLFPDEYIGAFPTGISICGFLVALYWLLLSKTIQYQKQKLLILGLFYGPVILAVIGCILCFLYLSKHSFSGEFAAKENREDMSFHKLFKVYKKIWPFSIMIFSLLFTSLLFSPTLCFGFTPSKDSYAKTWGSVLLLVVSGTRAFGRIISKYRYPCFETFFSQQRIGLTLLGSYGSCAVVLLSIWFVQNDVFKTFAATPKSVWIDVAVVFFYAIVGFNHGYFFNILMLYAKKQCNEGETQRGSLMMTFSFTTGGLLGNLVSFGINFLNKSKT